MLTVVPGMEVSFRTQTCMAFRHRPCSAYKEPSPFCSLAVRVRALLPAENWEDVLVDGVIAPWRRGEAVCFRPPGWVVQGRPGVVEVPPRPVLIVEGVGAGRAGLVARAELVVWVQSDSHEARGRGQCTPIRSSLDS